MLIKNKYYTLNLCDKTGQILSFNNGKKEMILPGERPLFTIAILDENGTRQLVDASSATAFSLTEESGVITMKYALSNIFVTVTVRCPENERFCYWSIAAKNDTGCIIEWIDFPDVVVPDDLLGAGGSSRIFWPMAEGCLVENAELRENDDWIRKRPIGDQTTGPCGLYPGFCSMQFMAYYSDEGGLYFAAHDKDSHLKTVEQYKCGDGVRLEYRVFTEGAGEEYSMPYEMVIGTFDGDWHAAAEIYRAFAEDSTLELPEKLCKNPDIPDWMDESPVVIIYPIRGTKDTGDMTPNCYFPLKNSVPYLRELADDFDSRIMALPMHWEGTAPWAPPYVWPPFGGENPFKEFVDALHSEGNFVGVYCSGTGWTSKSCLVPEYNTEEQYENEHLESIMCRTPRGEVVQSKVIGPPIRYGYDMCPKCRRTSDIIVDEIQKIASSGCDYAQYFDQNLGGNGCLCYADDHGHPKGPGKWQGDAMISIFKRAIDALKKSGSNMILGCEAAAAEPFIKYLPFNDLRYNIGLFYGRPVPAYSYVYHEYINNFMGNQNSCVSSFDFDKDPDNLLFRIAYSFSAGDMMTVVLADKGAIHWDWDTEWTVAPPEQEPVKQLIKNLNAWRKGSGKDFLRYGRMQEPVPISNTETVSFVLKKSLGYSNGWNHVYPALLTSNWESPDGRRAQVVTNYGKCLRTFRTESKLKMRLYTSPNGESIPVTATDEIEIKPLSAVMVEFLD